MNLLNIESGWWVTADNRFVRCYNSESEAIAHIKYQQEIMGSNADWKYHYIKITFVESKSIPNK